MLTRIYDSRLLDFQVAPCNNERSAAGLPLMGLKTQLAGALDKLTLATIPDQFLPMALRWRCSPEVGLPVTPFKIYKRKKSIAFAEIPTAAQQVAGGQMLIGGPYWQVSFTLKNTGPVQSVITVAPMNQNSTPYPDAKLSYTLAPQATAAVTIRFPNIYGLTLLAGTAAILSISGVPIEEFLNTSGWQLVETVGLPFKAAGPPAAAYQNDLQGYPGAPASGYQAAINRLAIAQLFYKPPVLTQPDNVTLPAWPAPAPITLVDSYHKQQPTIQLQPSDSKITGILYDIEELLTRVNSPSTAGLYGGRQAAFIKQYGVDSFSDTGATDGTKAGIQNPVCGMTLLGIASDCWNALGLGFGTTDFASPVPADECDYMVSAQFNLPNSNWILSEGGGFVPVFDHLTTYEIAALAHPALALAAVTGLGSEVHAENRPVATDARFSDDVKLYWDNPGNNVPASYAVAVADSLNGQVKFLNAPRPFLPGNYRPHLPTARADAQATDEPGTDAANLNRFFHHRSERSDTAIAQKTYYVAPIDVFGRWSPFQKTASNLPQAPQVVPDIISGQFLFGTGANTYNATLELVVTWHWDDRTPFEIGLGGYFFNLLSPSAQIDTTNIAKPPSISLDKVGMHVIELAISFNGTDFLIKKLGPGAAGNASKEEAEIFRDDANSALPGMVAYKIRIKGFKLAFDTTGKLAFAAYLRSRQKLTPGITAGPGKVKMIYALDPLPRDAPALSPDIQWGSLPDARNISRYRVLFDAVPGATGYAIYRATEASLREKCGLQGIPQDTSLTTRRDQLLTLAKTDLAKDAFIRVNKEMLPAPYADVDLPGDLNGLYIYALTSFSGQRVESGFGAGRLYVSVPQRYTPPSPVLSAFAGKTGAQRQVTLKVEMPQGVPASSLEIFRTNKSYLASSIDLMGPPALRESLAVLPAGWKAYDAQDGEITVVQKNKRIAYYKITQVVQPGWLPLHYRAAAFGADDRTAGKLPGRSNTSNLVAVQVAPPDDAPLILNTALQLQKDGTLRLKFFTDAPAYTTPYGSFRLSIRKRNTATNLYEEVLLKDLPAILAMKPGEVPFTNTIWRIGKDAAGNTGYEHYVIAEDAAWYSITITDPLGRSTTAKLQYLNAAPVIRNLVMKPLRSGAELTFEINRNTDAPHIGHYLLEIFTQQKAAGNNVPLSTLVYSGNLDALSSKKPAANPAVYLSSATGDGFFVYSASFGATYTSLFSGASVLLRVTDPLGRITDYSSLSAATK